MTRQLTINFYRVTPDSDLLPVLRRKLDDDQAKRDWETLLKVPKRDSYERFAILSQWPFEGDTSQYATHEMRFDALPRLTRIRLLDDSLVECFRQRGLGVIRRKFSFAVHGQDAEVPYSTEGIDLRRGVEFRLDSVFIGDRRQYGYFITLKVSRSFSIGLENTTLQKAATGQQVYVGDHPNDNRATLLGAEGGNAKVLFAEGSTSTVDVGSIRVPASNEIVKRYLLESGLRADAFGQLLAKEQQVAMRRTPRGQKRRDASKAQSDYVSTWLVNNSDYGRLRFAWAYSDATVSLVSTQHTVKRVEDF